jgi:O-acetylserine/cysteine efflux transporter
MHNHRISSLHYLLASIVTTLWGFNFVFSKAAVGYFEPFTLLLLRFLIASSLLLPFFPKPPISMIHIIKISFLFVILHLGTMFWSLHAGLDASVGVVVLQMHVPFLMILSIFFFKEKINIKCIVGIILTIIGSIFLMETPNSITHPLPFFLMLSSALFVAFYSIQIKKIPNVNALALITWISVCAVFMLIPIVLIFESFNLSVIINANANAIGSLLYITIGSSIIGHSLWAYLLSKNPIGSIAPITLLVPVIGIYAGVVMLGELLSIYILAGSTLMIIGVGIIVIKRPKTTQIELK